MDISLENVVEKFKLYTGEPMDGADQRRDALCRELCAGCAQEAAALPWREDISSSDKSSGSSSGSDESSGSSSEMAAAGESLAAAAAFVQLALLDRAAMPEAVSAPELKVTLGDKAGYARSLRDEMLRACERFLGQRGFYFGAI